jgi:opacity protein-like surface antigen
MRKTSLLALAIAGAGCALAMPAYAQDTGPYVGISAGVMFPRDTTYNAIGGGFPVNTVIDHDDIGFDGDVNVGYDFGMFRLEGEFGYKRASVNSEDTRRSNAFAAAGNNIDGHSQVTSLMANALIDIGDPGGVNFFAGGGAGIAWHKFNYTGNIGPATLANPNGAPFTVEDSDSAFAWQLLAGVRFPVSENVDLGLKYRYFDAGRFTYDGSNANNKFRSHSVLATLTFNFGRSAEVVEVAPPPPPPPVRPGERG